MKADNKPLPSKYLLLCPCYDSLMRIITTSATEPGEDITNAVRPNFSGHADRAGIELSLKSINYVMYNI